MRRRWLPLKFSFSRTAPIDPGWQRAAGMGEHHSLCQVGAVQITLTLALTSWKRNWQPQVYFATPHLMLALCLITNKEKIIAAMLVKRSLSKYQRPKGRMQEGSDYTICAKNRHLKLWGCLLLYGVTLLAVTTGQKKKENHGSSFRNKSWRKFNLTFSQKLLPCPPLTSNPLPFAQRMCISWPAVEIYQGGFCFALPSLMYLFLGFLFPSLGFSFKVFYVTQK